MDVRFGAFKARSGTAEIGAQSGHTEAQPRALASRGCSMNSPRRRLSEQVEKIGNIEGTARPASWSALLICPSQRSAKMANRRVSEGRVSGPLMSAVICAERFHPRLLRPSQTRLVRTSNSFRNGVDEARINRALLKAPSEHSRPVFARQTVRQMSTRSCRVA